MNGSSKFLPIAGKPPFTYDLKQNIPETTKSTADIDSSFAPWSSLCDDNDIWCIFNDTSWDANITSWTSNATPWIQDASYNTATDVTLSNISFNSSNATDISENIPLDYWNLLLLIFPLFTVFGNVLVVMSVVRERQLKTATNYFICSLAVADIMVAVVVMPPAVYMEVVKSWLLSDALCDAWVASDVMACTASILNLTAISVDRFIAVTQPIKYSKHKNSKRVFVTLALTWVISVAIATPIAVGVNYSEERKPGACAFFNSDFLIYSSMGSFYIPSLIMMFLYYRIYRVLHLRARALKNKKAKTLKSGTSNVIENTATINATKMEPTIKTGLAKSMDNGKISTYNTNNKTTNQLLIPVCDDNVSNMATNTDSSERYNEEDSGQKSQDSDPDDRDAELIVNPVAVRHVEIQIDGNGNGTCNVDTQLETETKFSSTPSSERRGKPSEFEHKCKLIPANDNNSTGNQQRRKEKRTVGNYFHRRASRKRKEKSSSKREKKATKTLAIVLGVFLFCWVPFFTINIANAICIKFKYKLSSNPICNPNMILFSVFVWLGYINSFLNPVIYTIFNPEFRKAFKKILTECCSK